MTKLSTPSYRFSLKKSKVKPNGEYPIVLTVSFNGKVERATSIYILPKYWDANRQRVKKTCPNHRIINDTLDKMIRKYQDRKNYLESKSLPITAKTICSKEDMLFSKSNDVMDLIESHLKRNSSNPRTRNY